MEKSPANVYIILIQSSIDYDFFWFILSGPNDHIFIFFTDHGAPGLIAFPDDEVSLFFCNVLKRSLTGLLTSELILITANYNIIILIEP